MNQTRRPLIVQMITFLLVISLIVRAWAKEDLTNAKSDTTTPSVVSTSEESREIGFGEQILEVQARYLVGLKILLNKVLSTDRLSESPEIRTESAQLNAVFRNNLLAMLKGSSPQSSRPTTITQRFEARKKAILARYLEINDEANDLIRSIASTSTRTNVERQLDDILLRTFGESPAPTLSVPEQELIQRELGWFGDLAVALTLNPVNGGEFIAERIEGPAHTAAKKLLVFLGFLLIGGITSLLLFAYFAFRYTRSKQGKFTPSPVIASDATLEVFALYLAGMLLLSFGIEALIRYRSDLLSTWGPSSVLVINCLGIVSLLLLILWPITRGLSLQDIRRALGLNFGGIREILSNIALAPTFYLAAWTPLIVILFFYSIVLQVLNVDITGGAHPVIPMLMKDDNSSTFSLVLFLAVVIAPFVEEIMFRGALYNWMRSRWGVKTSIFASALVFASVHPQGILGLVPLTSIGVILAILREWRGNLVAPMFAHACFNAGTIMLVSQLLH